MHSCLRLLGFASFAITAVPYARLYMRELQRVVIPLQIIEASMETLIPVASALQGNLRFWAQLRLDQAARVIAADPPVHHLFTDACPERWGAHWGQETLSTPWDPEEALLEINTQELLAIFKAFEHFVVYFRGHYIT